MKETYYSKFPHIHPIGAIFFVTFNLQGAIPKDVLHALQEERFFKSTTGIYTWNDFERYDTYLDNKKATTNYLSNPKIAQLIEDKIKSLETEGYYEVVAFCIMSNHVHLLLNFDKQIEGLEEEITDENYVQLEKVLRLLKGSTAFLANKLLKREGTFWAKDSFNRYMRDEKELVNVLHYILQNPVKAGLVKKWTDWPYSYVKPEYLELEAEKAEQVLSQSDSEMTEVLSTDFNTTKVVPTSLMTTKVVSTIPSPAYVLEEAKLLKNLKLLQYVQQQAGVQIILALKAFALWKVFPTIAQYLSGATASSLNEALLINKHFRSQETNKVNVHTYAPAYIPEEFDELQKISSHITFNSINQFLLYKEKMSSEVSYGLRVNPEYSPVETDLYNPAARGGRLGETIENIETKGLPKGIEGLHFHVLCESTSYDLEQVLVHFEERFGKYFPQLKWVNFGGGHLITHKTYDVEHLIQVLKTFNAKYPYIQFILEPGSATAWQTGDLVTKVLDIVENHGIKTAMLDTSFTCHMPDTLEMPYRPNVVGTSPSGSFSYRLGGISCLAGDFLEAYSFEKELNIGDTLIVQDMLHYTTVKTTMFNGVGHPSIYLLKTNGQHELLRAFSFKDYEMRMC